jgi:poly(beta-D-mannuronate) C5 epimerase
MAILSKNSIAVAATVLLSSMTGLIPHQEQQLHYFNSAEAGGACIDYDQRENTIAINCSASFLDVVQAINDPEILENSGDGEYILNANLEVADDVTFEMNSNENGLQYLKITGANGIIVYGTILIDGVIITSWDVSDEDVIQQNNDGSIRRAYIQFDGSEDSEIINSEFAYLGYQELGKRGFDLWGPDASYSGEGSSHDMMIRGSKFHNMWFAFYSRGAYNIVVDGNEYHHNVKYALDPHSGTHDMNITNNWLHHNPIGAICSDRCSNILIEGNRVEHNTDHGIFFSRNMYDSIARNNYILNTTSGITVSESPNNQIYNNTIEGATSYGVHLFNPPEPPYDGLTENNLVYNNAISSSEDGISTTRSHDNILENNIFSNIQSSEYSLSGDSSIIIGEQHFDNAIIAQEGSATENVVEIVDSGIIEVIEGESDGEEEGEGELYNTDSEPFRRTLSDGDSITVNSLS